MLYKDKDLPFCETLKISDGTKIQIVKKTVLLVKTSLEAVAGSLGPSSILPLRLNTLHVVCYTLGKSCQEWYTLMFYHNYYVVILTITY